MTVPGNRVSSGKEELEHGGLERDQLLELKRTQHQPFFFFFILNPVQCITLVAEMHELYCFQPVALVIFILRHKEALPYST